MSKWIKSWQTADQLPIRPYIMAITDGNDWPLRSCIISGGEPSGGGPYWPAGITSPTGEERAALIVAAVNACLEINPDNPMAAAKAMAEMMEACKMAADVIEMLRTNPREWAKATEHVAISRNGVGAIESALALGSLRAAIATAEAPVQQSNSGE